MAYESSDGVIGAIYDAAASVAFDAELIKALRAHFQTHSLILYSVNSRTQSVERAVTTAPEPLMQLHAERLHQSDLWLTRAFQHAVGRATRSDDYVTEAELLRTEFHDGILSRIDVRHALTSLVPFDTDGGFAIGLHHTARQGSFSDDAKRRLDALLPHFVRAERMRRRLQASDALGTIGLDALDALSTAAIVCGADGRVLYANAAAERLDQAREALVLNDGSSARTITASTPEAAAKLRRAIASAASRHPGQECGGTLLLARPHRKPLIAVVTPLPRRGDKVAPRALILISDPEHLGRDFRQRTREAFGFTAAEARLAEALVRGIGREDYAATVGITRNTIKSQMRALLWKTDAHRESDLMRILLAMPRSE